MSENTAKQADNGRLLITRCNVPLRASAADSRGAVSNGRAIRGNSALGETRPTEKFVRSTYTNGDTRLITAIGVGESFIASENTDRFSRDGARCTPK